MNPDTLTALIGSLMLAAWTLTAVIDKWRRINADIARRVWMEGER